MLTRLSEEARGKAGGGCCCCCCFGLVVVRGAVDLGVSIDWRLKWSEN